MATESILSDFLTTRTPGFQLSESYQKIVAGLQANLPMVRINICF